MEISVLLEIYQLDAPRVGLDLALMAILGFLLFLSYRYPRLGWLYKKFPVMIPFLQMCFITLLGIEFAILFANLWADKEMYSEAVAIFLSVISILVVRAYLSYWYRKYPISNKLHKL